LSKSAIAKPVCLRNEESISKLANLKPNNSQLYFSKQEQLYYLNNNLRNVSTLNTTSYHNNKSYYGNNKLLTIKAKPLELKDTMNVDHIQKKRFFNSNEFRHFVREKYKESSDLKKKKVKVKETSFVDTDYAEW
jgi:hypothetical protein